MDPFDPSRRNSPLGNETQHNTPPNSSTPASIRAERQIPEGAQPPSGVYIADRTITPLPLNQHELLTPPSEFPSYTTDEQQQRQHRLELGLERVARIRANTAEHVRCKNLKPIDVIRTSTRGALKGPIQAGYGNINNTGQQVHSSYINLSEPIATTCKDVDVQSLIAALEQKGGAPLIYGSPLSRTSSSSSFSSTDSNSMDSTNSSPDTITTTGISDNPTSRSSDSSTSSTSPSVSTRESLTDTPGSVQSARKTPLEKLHQQSQQQSMASKEILQTGKDLQQEGSLLLAATNQAVNEAQSLQRMVIITGTETEGLKKLAHQNLTAARSKTTQLESFIRKIAEEEFPLAKRKQQINDLEEGLNSLMDETNKLYDMLKTQEINLNNHSEKTDQLSDTLEYAKVSKLKLEQQLQILKEADHRHRPQIQRLQDEKQTLERQTLVTKELSEANAEIAKLKAAIDSELLTSKKNNRTLQEQISSQHRNDDDLKKNCQALNQYLTTSRNQIGNVQRVQLQVADRLHEAQKTLRTALAKAMQNKQALLQEEAKQQLTEQASEVLTSPVHNQRLPSFESQESVETFYDSFLDDSLDEPSLEIQDRIESDGLIQQQTTALSNLEETLATNQQNLQERLTHANSKVFELGIALAEATKQAATTQDRLQRQNHRLARELDHSEQKLNDTHRAFQEVVRHNEALNEQLNHHQLRYTALTAALKKRFAEPSSEFLQAHQSELEDLENAVCQMLAEQSTLSANLLKAERDASETKEQLARSKNELAEDREKLRRERKELAGAQQQILQLSGELDQHKQQLNTLAQMQAETTASLRESEESVDELRDQNRQLTEQLSDQKAITAHQQNQEQAQTKELESLQAQLAALTQKADQLQHRNDQLAAELTTEQNQRIETQQAVKTLQTQLQINSQESITAQAAINRLQQTLAQRKQQLQGANEEQEQQRLELQQKSFDLTDLSERLTSSEAINKSQSQELALLTEQLQQKEALDRAHGELMSKLAEAETTRHQLEIQLQEQQTTYEALRTSHQRQQQGNEELQALLAENSREQESLRQQLETQEKQLSSQNSWREVERKAFQSQVIGLEEQLRNSQAAENVLRQKVLQFQQSTEGHQQKLDSQREAAQKMAQQLQLLDQELASKTQELTEKSLALAHVEEEFEQAREEVAKQIVDTTLSEAALKAQLNRQKQEFQEQIDQFRGQYEQLELERNQLAEEHKQQQLKIDELTELKELNQQDRSELNAKLANQEKRLAETHNLLEEDRKQAREEVQAKIKELNNALTENEELTASFQKQIDELQQTLKMQQLDLNARKHDFTQASQALQRQELVIAQKTKQLEEKNIELVSLQQQHQLTTAQLGDAQNGQQDQQQKLEQTKAQLLEATTQATALSEKLLAATAKQSHLNQQLLEQKRDYEQQLEQQSVENLQTQADLQSAKKEQIVLTESIEQIQAEKILLTAEINKLASINGTLKSNLAVTEDAKTHLEQENSAIRAHWDTLQNSLVANLQFLSKGGSERRNLRDSINSAEAENFASLLAIAQQASAASQLDLKLDEQAIQNALQILTHEWEELQARITTLHNQNLELSQQLGNIEQQLESAGREFHDKTENIDDLEQQLHTSEQHRKSLLEQQAQLQQRLQESEDAITQTKADSQYWLKREAQVQTTLDTTLAQLQTTKEQLQELQSQIIAEEQAAASSQQQPPATLIPKETLDELQSYQRQVQDLRQKLDDQRADMETLESDNIKSHRDYSALKNEIDQRDNLLQRLAEQIIHAEQNTLELKEALEKNNDKDNVLAPIIYMVEELNPNGISAPHDYPKLANQLKEWGIAPEIDENQSTTFAGGVIGTLFGAAKGYQSSNSSDGEVSDSQDSLTWDEDKQELSFLKGGSISSQSGIYFDEDGGINTESGPFTDETDEELSVFGDEDEDFITSSDEETFDNEENKSKEVRAYPLQTNPDLITIDDRTHPNPSKSGRWTS